MQVKCIGGVCDGIFAHVPDHYKINDHIEVFKPMQNPLKVPPIDYSEPIAISKTGYLYRLAILNFSGGDKFYFLVPSNWSDKEAILFQFRK